jgi:YHS domain-containing protein
MLKILLIIVCVYWAWRLFKKISAPMGSSHETPTGGSGQSAATELVRDPVCNTYIDKTTAIFRNGNYFCSETCAEKFTHKEAV